MEPHGTPIQLMESSFPSSSQKGNVDPISQGVPIIVMDITRLKQTGSKVN